MASISFVGHDSDTITMIDEPTALVTYVGVAMIGSSTSEAVWRIMKISKEFGSHETAINWADGNKNFDNVWNDRDSYTYS